MKRRVDTSKGEYEEESDLKRIINNNEEEYKETKGRPRKTWRRI